MKITVCRQGKSLSRCNRHAKGKFVKKFDSIEQLAKFIRSNWRIFFYPNLKKEITKEQMLNLNRKCYALARIERNQNE